MKKLLMIVMSFVVLLGFSIRAEVPNTISYQGILGTLGGKVVDDGNYDLVFRLYNVQTGGSQLWQEDHNNVPVFEGRFHIILGSLNSLASVDFDVPYWLGITVEPPSAELPRIMLTSSAYSLQSRSVSDQAVTSPKIAEGAVTASKINTDGATNGQSLVFDGSALVWQDAATNFSLPFSTTYSGAIDAFSIFTSAVTASRDILHLEARGTDDRVAVFSITDENNEESTMLVSTQGPGSAASFHSSNPTSSTSAVYISTEGAAPALSVTSFNTSNKAASINGNMTVDGALVVENVENSELWGMAHILDYSLYEGIHVEMRGTSGRACFLSNTNTNNGEDVLNVNQHGDGNAVIITSSNPENDNAALYISNSGTAPTIQSTSSGGGLAGLFSGDVHITGTLSKSGGSFKIDHPLYPETKSLQHSFVESPDMMNIYNGNVVLDGNGSASVELPEYFEALNMDFRYQLTAIGAPGPDLHISSEINNNSFDVAGGKPGMKVSWQITGVRHDKWAESHRIRVEIDK